MFLCFIFISLQIATSQMEPCFKLQVLSSACTDVLGWIINWTHHSKGVFKNPGLSTLHSCHNQYVPFRGKDVHGLMVIRRRVPFYVSSEEEKKKPWVCWWQRISSTLILLLRNFILAKFSSLKQHLLLLQAVIWKSFKLRVCCLCINNS